MVVGGQCVQTPCWTCRFVPGDILQGENQDRTRSQQSNACPRREIARTRSRFTHTGDSEDFRLNMKGQVFFASLPHEDVRSPGEVFLRALARLAAQS